MVVHLDPIGPTIVLQSRHSDFTGPSSTIDYIVNHFYLFTIENHFIDFSSFDRPLHR